MKRASDAPALRGSPPLAGAEPPSGRGGAARLLQRGLAWTAVLAVLLGTFALYLRPSFLMDIADRVWSCF